MVSKSLVMLISALLSGVVCIAASGQEAKKPKTTPSQPSNPSHPGQTPEEIKARQAKYEELRKLVEAYKANPTEENKAKVVAQIRNKIEESIKTREARMEQEKAAIEKMKKDKESIINMMLQRMLNSKPEEKGSGKPAEDELSALPSMLPAAPSSK